MLGGTRDRHRPLTLKAVGISVSLALSYFMLRMAVTPDRMQRDEIYVGGDLLRVVETGHISEPAGYAAGQGYTAIVGVLLGVVGGEYPALEFLSPTVGVVGVAIMTLVAVALLRDLDSRAAPWAAIGVPATLFVFAGFTVRLAESSHKTFTFSLVFLGLLAAFRCYTTGGSGDRWRGLFVAFVATIAAFNYIWAVAYGGAAILAMFLSGLPRQKVLVIGAVPPVVAYGLPLHLPTGGINLQYLRSILTRAPGDGGQVVGDVGISAWEPITVAGATVSSWYLYTLGVVVVAVIGAAAGVHALARLHDDSPALARFYTGVGVWFACLAGGLLAAGDLATFKRVIVIPGAIGVLYALHTLSVTPSLTPRRRRIALNVIVLILVVGAVLGVPRGVLDGDPAPYDYYAEESEKAKFEWWLANDPPNRTCLRTHQFVDLTTSHLVWGLERRGGVEPIEFEPRMSIVYASSQEAFLTCTPYRGRTA